MVQQNQSTFYQTVTTKIIKEIGFFKPKDIQVITTDHVTSTRFVFIFVYSDIYQEVFGFDMNREVFIIHDMAWIWSLVADALLEEIRKIPATPIGDHVVLSEN